MTQVASILKSESGIDPGYQHTPKRATPGNTIERSGIALKWYTVYPDDRPVPEELTRLARSYLRDAPLEAKGLGFVILHRCGNDFYFLIVNTWRNNNELWETVFYKNGDAMADFAPFARDAMHKPTFCVWELAPVLYETKAWERFLKSARDETAAHEWLGDCYSGPA
jgi:hypothetical protein